MQIGAMLVQAQGERPYCEQSSRGKVEPAKRPMENHHRGASELSA